MTGYIKKKKITSQKLFDAFVFITLTIMKANVDGRLMSSFLYRYGSPPGLERISPELPWLYISLINISLDLGISSEHPQYRLVVSMHSVSSQWVSRMLSQEKILVVYAAFFTSQQPVYQPYESPLAYTDFFCFASIPLTLTLPTENCGL